MSVNREQVVAPFIRKLYELLEDPTNHEYIKWSEGACLSSQRILPAFLNLSNESRALKLKYYCFLIGVFSFEDGDGVVVVEPDGLMANVLNRYYKQVKLCSFVRQMNIYGFVKQNDWEFRHGKSYFRRGQPELLTQIKRRQSIKTARENDETEMSREFKRRRESSPEDSEQQGESARLLEERFNSQEMTIHWLLDTVYRQKNELVSLQNQLSVLSHYVLSLNNGANSSSIQLPGQSTPLIAPSFNLPIQSLPSASSNASIMNPPLSMDSSTMNPSQPVSSNFTNSSMLKGSAPSSPTTLSDMDASPDWDVEYNLESF